MLSTALTGSGKAEGAKKLTVVVLRVSGRWGGKRNGSNVAAGLLGVGKRLTLSDKAS